MSLVHRNIGDAGHIADHNAIADYLAGPPFVSASGGVAVTESATLTGGGDCETTTGWVSVNTGAFQSISTAGLFTQGTKSVKSNTINIGWDNNPLLTTKIYRNLDSSTAVGSYSHLALDLRWVENGTPSNFLLGEVFELFVSDAIDMGGTLISYAIPNFAQTTWTTVRIPLGALANIRCVGVRSIAAFYEPGRTGQNITLYFDNMRLAAQTELDTALASSSVVLIPPSYTPTGSQALLDVPTTKALMDLRPGLSIISGYGGTKHVRQFQVTEDGTTDVTAQLNHVVSLLQPGDRLEFPPTGRYKVSGSVKIRDLSDVVIDGRGCKIYTTATNPGHLLLSENVYAADIGNFRLYGNNPLTDTGSSMTTFAGSPTFPGDGTVQLTAQGQAVRLTSTARYGFNVDDVIPFDFTIKQSADPASVTGDVMFEVLDLQAPTTAPSAVASGSDGPVAPGTRYYRVTFMDMDGNETTASPSVSYTNTVGANVALSSIPVGTDTDVPIVARRIYRTLPDPASVDDPRGFQFVGTLADNTTTTFTDNWSDNNNQPAGSISVSDGGAGNIAAGSYIWRFTVVATNGTESFVSTATSFTLGANKQASLTVPTGVAGTIRRKIYRTKVGAAGSVRLCFLVGTIEDNVTTAFTDNVADASLGIAAVDATTSVPPPVRAMELFTPTTSDAVHRFTWRWNGSLPSPRVVVRKVTSATNTITITQCATTTRAAFNSARESSSAVGIGRGCVDVRVHDIFATGVGGDAVALTGDNARDIVIERIRSHGVARQGLSVVGGRSVILRDIIVRDCGRSGIDVEPTGSARVQDITLENIQIYNCSNVGIAFLNWTLIRNMFVRHVRVYGSSVIGPFQGGAILGAIEDVRGVSGAAIVYGQNMRVNDLFVNNLTLIDTSTSAAFGGVETFTGGHTVDNVHFLGTFSPDASGCQIGDAYEVSGPAPNPTATLFV